MGASPWQAALELNRPRRMGLGRHGLKTHAVSYIQNAVFEWDAKKATGNEAKHGVSFEEASTAFFDPAGVDGEDLEHSLTEKRRFRLAQSAGGKILVIAYTVRSHGHEKKIRLISARLANRKEKKRYQEAQD